MLLSVDIIKIVILGGLAAYLAWRYRHKIYKEVNQWLNQNNLTKAALTEVRVIYDHISVGARNIVRKLFVSTNQGPNQKISEEIISKEELRKRDPEIYEWLQNHSCVEQNILEQFQ
ncbi:MAG: hypothetical protein RIC07_27065 [Coleofasciculus sp. E1-EBD-02]